MPAQANTGERQLASGAAQERFQLGQSVVSSVAPRLELERWPNQHIVGPVLGLHHLPSVKGNARKRAKTRRRRERRRQGKIQPKKQPQEPIGFGDSEQLKACQVREEKLQKRILLLERANRILWRQLGRVRLQGRASSGMLRTGSQHLNPPAHKMEPGLALRETKAASTSTAVELIPSTVETRPCVEDRSEDLTSAGLRVLLEIQLQDMQKCLEGFHQPSSFECSSQRDDSSSESGLLDVDLDPDDSVEIRNRGGGLGDLLLI